LFSFLYYFLIPLLIPRPVLNSIFDIVEMIPFLGKFLADILRNMPLEPQLGISLQIFFTGLVTSATYSILALGFSLIFGIAKQLKLSLGGYYVTAAYLMFFLLEARKIIPQNQTDFDGIFLLAIFFIPVALIMITIAVLWKKFVNREFLIIMSSLAISMGGLILLGVILLRPLSLGEIFYVALAVIALCIAGFYLELPKFETAIGSSIIGIIIIPLLFILRQPVVYLALMILAVIFTACLAMLSDRYLLEKIRHSHTNVMIITFSLALLLQSFVQMIYFPDNGNELIKFGPEDRNLTSIVSISRVIRIFGALILETKIVAFIFVIVAALLVYFFIWKSKMGMALRAVSQDEEAAALAGIDIRKTTAIVSGVGMGLIAVAAILTSPFAAKPQWSPFMGWSVLIIAIAIVTLGGLGSLSGSMIAAFIFGYAEVNVSSIPSISDLSGILPFIVVFLVMIIRPEGIFGEKKELEG
ncbi:MAG: branched-chain amino acid ABC transporter permease, partial [Candidatus Hodarchaeales archaeon]